MMLINHLSSFENKPRFMTIKTLIFCTITFIFSSNPLFAQMEIGGGFSVNSYQGDLREPLNGFSNIGGYLSNHAKTAQMGGNFLVRYNLSPKISLRGGILYTELSGSDALGSISFRRPRNLSFKTHLLEFSGVVEYNLFPMGMDIHSRTWTPYVAAGLALFNFNPKAFYEGEWVELQPLGTEGQDLYQFPDRKMYSLTQLAIPFSIGAKFLLSKSLVLGVDLSYRFAMTDYLDDVSKTHVDPELLRSIRGDRAAALSARQGEINPRFRGIDVGRARGNPDNNDGYFSIAVTVAYRLQKYDCPTFRR